MCAQQGDIAAVVALIGSSKKAVRDVVEVITPSTSVVLLNGAL